MSDSAIISLKELQKEAKDINVSLDRYWDEVIKRQEGIVREVLTHSKEHNLRGGKRLRATLVKWGYELIGKKNDERLNKVMVGIELVHTALLMHDDFMDRDKMRRGGETTQAFFGKEDKHFGESMAIGAGDIVLNLGYGLVLDCGFESEKVVEIGKYLMRTIEETAYGQVVDISLMKEKHVSEENIRFMYEKKTAKYTFENPLIMGLILAGGSEEIKEKVKEFSKLAGVAYQIQDDILGLFGDEEVTGKSADSDLRQKKVTLLAEKVLRNEEYREMFLKGWGREEATEDEIALAKKAVVDSGVLEKVKKEVEEKCEEAKMKLTEMETMGVDDKVLNLLEGIVDYIREREN